MKILIMRFMPLLACLWLAACATNIQTDHAPGVMFASFQTFRWKEPQNKNRQVKNPVLDSDILDQRIKNAVINTLLGRGYNRAPKGKPADFDISYHTTSRQTLESRGGFSANFGYSYGYPFGFGGIFSPYPYGNDLESQQEGALVLDITNPTNNRLVWRGWQTEEVTQANFSNARVQTSVREILKQFPPR